MIIRCATAAAITSGGPAQTIAVGSGAGSGDLPKAAIYEITSTTTLNAAGTHRRHGIGITDGTSQRCVGVMAEGGQLAFVADAGTRANNAAVIDLPLGTSEAVDGVAAWTSWQAGGSEITWSDFPATAMQVKATYFFGDDIDCKVVEFLHAQAGAEEQEITGVGFRPNFAFAITYGDGSVAFPSSSGAGDLLYSFGYAINSPFDGNEEEELPPDPDRVFQWCYGDYLADRAAPNTSGTTFRDDSFVCPMIEIASLGSIQPVSIARFTSDGAVLAVPAAGTSDRYIAILFIRFRSRRLIAGTESVGGPVTTVLETGFRPEVYIACGTRISVLNGTGDSSAPNVGKVSHGIYTGPENVYVSGVSDDAVASSLTASKTGNNNVFDVRDTSAGVVFSATHVSLDDESFTIEPAGTGISDDNSYFGWVAIGGPIMVLDETVSIVDEAVLTMPEDLFLSILDTVSIVDFETFVGDLVISDTETIDDDGNFAGDALMVLSDTVEIQEDVQQYLGAVIVLSDTETITDEVNFGSGPGRIKSGGARGSTFQGGAEEGESLQGGAERGTVIGG